MTLLNITFFEIIKVWLVWNVVPYIIGLIIVFSLLGLWMVVIKLKGGNPNNHYISYSKKD